MNKLTKAFSLSALGLSLAGSFAFAIASNTKGSLVKEYDQFGGEVVKHLTEEEVANNIRFEPLYTPNDQYYSTQKTRSMSNVGDIERVWDNYKGDGTTIAVIDSGIDYMHPDFYSNANDYSTCKILKESAYFYTTSSNRVSKQVVGVARNTLSSQSQWDVLLHDWDDEYDEWEAHGSNVASSAAAAANSVGTVGIAPNAKILALKIDFFLSTIDQAIRYATDQGVDVINMSLGAYAETFTDGYGDEQTGSASTASALTSAINYAYSHGVIVIAAAGNENTDHYSYPACNDHVIGVGALAKNSGTSRASFSNYNKTTDTASGNHNVDISAPGYVYAANEGGTQSSPNHSAYCDTQGTSFASPIVAGAAALYKEKYPTATPDEFEQALYNSAVDIGTTGWDKNFGYGRLDVAELLGGDISVTGISMSSSAETIYVNSTMADKNKVQLTATLAPANPTNKGITWSTSKSSVATVDSTGLVTAVGTGTCVITATSADGGYTATCTITVSNWVSVSSITVKDSNNAKSSTIHKNETVQLSAEVLPTNATWQEYVFLSNNDAVATVSNNGLVRGKGVGTTTIYAWAEDGDVMDEYTITVETVQADNTLVFNFYNASKLSETNGTSCSGNYLNQHATLNGVAVDSNFITNYSTNSTTVAYDKMGGLTLGSSSKKGTLSFAIPEDYTIADVEIVGNVWDANQTITINDVTPSSGSLGAKGTALENITDSLLYEGVGGNTFNISTNSGRVTIFTMTVTLGGGAPNVPVTGVSIKNHENIDISSLTLDVDQTEQLNAVITPDNATNKTVSWSSNNTSVASVSSAGLVTAVSAGNATITVTTQDGSKTDTLNVTVNALADSVSINSTATVTVGQTTTISATASGAVTWTAIDGTGSVSLSNQSNTGVTITGVTAGSATVRATVGTATSDCAVTVNAASGGTETTVEYKFTNASWNATLNGTSKNWTAGKNGAGFTANQGIQVTTGASGANGTCKESYTSISNVTVKYTTNASKGAGNIAVSIGSDSNSQAVTKDGGTTVRSLSYDFASNPTGNVQISVTCTTNSIYVYGCTITYSEGGVPPTPDPIRVTGVTVSPTSLTLDANGNGNSKTGQLTAQLQTEGTTGEINRNINWSTGDSNVATVSNTGLVTAVGQGTTTITATSAEDGTKFASCAVTVTASTREVVSIEITTAPTKTTYAEGDLFDPTGAVVTATYNYAPITEDVTSRVTWTPSEVLTTSNNKAYATFEGKTASVDITVLPNTPITSGYQRITSMSDLTDGEYVLAGVSGSTRYAFVNTFSNSDNYGEIAVTNNVISEQDASGYNITIVVSGSSYVLKNETKWLGASTTTSFTTTNSASSAGQYSIECVDGMFEIYNGSRGVMFRSGYGFKNYSTSNYTGQGYSRIELYKRIGGSVEPIHVTGISLNEESLSLNVNDTATLVATVTPNNADNPAVTWTTSDASVATVSSSGLVVALKAGTATITVTSNDVNTIFATCAVTVTQSGGGEVEEIEAAFNMTTVNQLVSIDANGGQWMSEGVTINGAKGTATTAFNNYYPGVSNYKQTRFYQGSVLTFSAPTGYVITQIVITCSGSSYLGGSNSSSNWSEGCTASANGAVSTIVVDNKASATLNVTSTQCRTTAITVTCASSGESPITAAQSWAASFIASLSCDATGNTAPSKTVWTEHAASFAALSADSKAYLTNATYTVGSDGMTVNAGDGVNQTIAEAVSKYDYIVSKYGASEYNNFMDRSISSNMLGTKVNNEQTTIIVATMSLLTLTTFTGIILKKKKLNTK